MKENNGKKKYRYTYYTATGKEEIDVDEKWYEILSQADKDILKKIVKRLKKKTTVDEFIESRVLPILEKEEKARIKNFQKIYGRKVKNTKM